MDARNVKTAADAKALVKERGSSCVKLGVVDLDDRDILSGDLRQAEPKNWIAYLERT